MIRIPDSNEVQIHSGNVQVYNGIDLKDRWAVLYATRLMLFRDCTHFMALAVYPIVNTKFSLEK